MMGASFQASIAAIFFNVLLDLLLSPNKLETLQRFSNVDPLLDEGPPLDPASTAAAATNVRVGLVSALTIVLINWVVVLAALLFFVVTVRMYIHAGYYYRAATHPSGVITPNDALAITLSTQVRTQAYCAATHPSGVITPNDALAITLSTRVRIQLYLKRQSRYYYRAAAHPSGVITPNDALAITLSTQVRTLCYYCAAPHPRDVMFLFPARQNDDHTTPMGTSSEEARNAGLQVRLSGTYRCVFPIKSLRCKTVDTIAQHQYTLHQRKRATVVCR